MAATDTLETLDPVERRIRAWWDSGEVESFRGDFRERFRRHLPSDPRVGRLKALYERCGFEPVNGFFALDASSSEYPLDFLRDQIRENLSDVRRRGGSGEAATREPTVLTAEEQALAAEVYTAFSELAAHYLTEFAPAQADLVDPLTFLDPIELADTLFLPFRQALDDVLRGRVPLNPQ